MSLDDLGDGWTPTHPGVYLFRYERMMNAKDKNRARRRVWQAEGKVLLNDWFRETLKGRGQL